MATAGAPVPFLVLHALHHADLFHFGLFVARDAKTRSIFGFAHTPLLRSRRLLASITKLAKSAQIVKVILPVAIARLLCYLNFRVWRHIQLSFFGKVRLLAGNKSIPPTVCLFVLEIPE
jgi:hypothetical protein